MPSLAHIINVAAAAALLYASGLFLGAHCSIRAGSTRGQEEIGPIDNYTCTANGAFPHEECDLFITCWNGSAILHRCTEVMLFDLRYNGCNWAEYVDCGDRNRPPTYPGTETPPATTSTQDPSISTSPTTPPPNSSFVCPGNGVFPHEEKCEYYWNCYEGEAMLVHCELDYLFDLRYNGCNFPELTDCGDRQRPPTVAPTTVTTTEGTRPTSTESSGGTTEPGNNSTTLPPSTTTGGPGFQCPEPNGQFPDPLDCGSFYSCVANIPIHESCPEGLHFNPDLKLCDWPASAGCEISKKK